MAGKGGARPGAGRPTKADEDKVRNLAIDAITEKHGGLKEGFIYLIESEEPALIKFVWEHAVGKPKEKVEHSSDPDNPIQLLFVPATGCEPISDAANND